MRPLVLVFLVMSLPALAQDDDAQDYDLEVRPLLCIVDARIASCEIRFEIEWRSLLAGYYCVAASTDDDALRCWAEASAGQHEDERVVAQSFDYLLNEGEDGEPLATATVEVLRKDSDDRRRRRRTRHVWDIL